MTPSLLLAIAFTGLVVASLAATATKVLQEYSRRELELFCQRRNQLKLFRRILHEDEQVLIAVDSLRVIGLLFFSLAIVVWYTGAAVAPRALTTQEILAGSVLIGLGAVAIMIWIPWTVAKLSATPFLYYLWRPLRIAAFVVRPVTLGIIIVDSLLRRLANRPESEEDEEEAFEDEIRSIVTEGWHEGLLEEDAREMIEGVIELGDADVSDIMTPRSNIDACDADLSWPDALRFIVDVGRTRIPVYSKTLDNVVGVLYVKDLLREMTHGEAKPQPPLRKLLREPWFVPTTKPLDEMLHEFQQTRRHLAIVVDEYRSVAGVVTIEDVLEEIVGEIVDESDKVQVEEIQTLDASTSEVLGTAHIDSVNDRLGLQLPDPGECDTIAGLVIRELGRIPKPGESIKLDGARLTVLDASRRRVDKLRIEKSGPTR